MNAILASFKVRTARTSKHAKMAFIEQQTKRKHHEDMFYYTRDRGRSVGSLVALWKYPAGTEGPSISSKKPEDLKSLWSQWKNGVWTWPEINQEVHSDPPAPGFRFDARSRVPLIFSNRSLVALECITWIAGLSKPWLDKTKEQLRQISKVIILLNRLNPAWSGRSQETK